jgi:hypothetical protein
MKVFNEERNFLKIIYLNVLSLSTSEKLANDVEENYAFLHLESHETHKYKIQSYRLLK